MQGLDEAAAPSPHARSLQGERVLGSLPSKHPIHLSNSHASPPADYPRAGAAFFPRLHGGKPIPSPKRGERSAETARGACEAPLACRAIGTPGRLRGVPRPLAIGDARLSALCCGDFGPPGPRFRLRHYPPELVQRCSSRPGLSVRRAVPVPSEPAVASRSRGTPLPAPPSERLRRRPSRARMIRNLSLAFATVKIYILHMYVKIWPWHRTLGTSGAPSVPRSGFQPMQKMPTIRRNSRVHPVKSQVNPQAALVCAGGHGG
jgi:hypothetical protein